MNKRTKTMIVKRTKSVAKQATVPVLNFLGAVAIGILSNASAAEAVIILLLLNIVFTEEK